LILNSSRAPIHTCSRFDHRKFKRFYG